MMFFSFYLNCKALHSQVLLLSTFLLKVSFGKAVQLWTSPSCSWLQQKIKVEFSADFFLEFSNNNGVTLWPGIFSVLTVNPGNLQRYCNQCCGFEGIFSYSYLRIQTMFIWIRRRNRFSVTNKCSKRYLKYLLTKCALCRKRIIISILYRTGTLLVLY